MNTNNRPVPRAVICSQEPWKYINSLDDYSIMIVNPDSNSARLQYLLSQSDHSLLITDQGESYRTGGLYQERLFWYTSGTTGDSKFCSFTQEQLNHTARVICHSYELTANDRYVGIMPLWHAHGQGFYWATKLAGSEQHFLSVQDVRSLPKFNPTFVTAIPDLLGTICNFNLPNLRFVRGASAPLSTTLYHALKNKFNVPVIEAFGMTEALSHCFTNPLNGEQRPGTVGLPDGITAKIENGHLYIQGPSVCVDGWYDTGDLAEVDSQGYYKILGRSRDQINLRGIKFNPVSLEKQLQQNLKELEQCVIFGSDSIKCVYTGKCVPTQIINFLTSLNSYCRPSLIKQVTEIPLAPNGKISRLWLDSYFSS
jgi:long-chain acyl-CoA synthetase